MSTEYRGHAWFDTTRLVPVYSIQARVDGGPWMHCHVNGEPLFFDSPRERDEHLASLTPSL